MTISKTRERSAHIRTALVEAARTREVMLADLPDSTEDHVIEVQRFNIECILGEVRAALERLEDGSYGTCLSCRTPIPWERLELRPWAAFCIRCAGR